MRLVSPSILSADFMNLGQDIEMLNEHSDLIHIDVMDGTLVPNISFGFSVIDPLGKIAKIPMDVHLMIINPDKYFERCAKAGTTYLSFHLEAARRARKSPSEWLKQIKGLGMKAGIAINPDISVKKLYPYLKDADFVLVMSVFAGFGGQKFIYETFDRIADLKAEIQRQGLDTMIEVDGGVNAENAGTLFECGVDMAVAGSSVFKSDNPAEAIKAIRNSLPR